MMMLIMKFPMKSELTEPFKALLVLDFDEISDEERMICGC